MRLRTVLIFAAAHFTLWCAFAVIAYGTDLDRLSSRSQLASIAAEVSAVLQYPHDLLLRSLPRRLIQEFPPVVMAAVALNSILWGTFLALLWHLPHALLLRPGNGK